MNRNATKSTSINIITPPLNPVLLASIVMTPVRHSGYYMCNACVILRKLTLSYKVHLCVSYESQNKQLLRFIRDKNELFCNTDAVSSLRGRNLIFKYY
jgi:hypothetical protein